MNPRKWPYSFGVIWRKDYLALIISTNEAFLQIKHLELKSKLYFYHKVVTWKAPRCHFSV